MHLAFITSNYLKSYFNPPAPHQDQPNLMPTEVNENLSIDPNECWVQL